ncbi:LamB/YcsF family protein [Donghicola mangrovi]|uniref:5-oxoprolinase subunit A n=1 Tax=Donghicola mangrovi TaxID=2729614 RepID=A0A850Q157_9RHOB|nr:5-oxoprolinase subunit PxpA [Donghicola mangrovi]NVO22724.1 LamB/YcsF family protein [Donghicola mangrovi]
MTTIDLNADMGESFGPWVMGDDAALLGVISSANVACGFHAGDPVVMAQTIAQAKQAGVAVGAHPGFHDLQGFGRRDLHLTAAELTGLVQYQLGAFMGMAAAAGVPVAHLKLHGALANMCARDQEMALVCYRAALAVAPDLRLFVIAGTQQQRAAEQLNATFSAEIFADRAYQEDATLVPRGQAGAVLHDPAEAADRVLQMVTEGCVISQSGKRVDVPVDTICLHGDTQGAIDMARAVRARLEGAGVQIAAPQ